MTPGHVITRQLNTRRAFAVAFVMAFLAISAVFVIFGSRALNKSDQGAGTTATERPVEVTWTDEAVETLERIPWIVRDSVRRSTEQRARADNVSLITRKLLEELRSGFLSER